MKVGVNLLFMRYGFNRGTWTYVDGLLGRAAQSRDSDSEWLLFTNERNHTALGRFGLPRHCCRASGPSRVTRVAFEQAILPALANRRGCDVLFCPAYLAPVRSRIPVVVTVHDTQFLDVPETMPWASRLLYRAVVPRGARAASSVITISQFSRDQIARYLGIDSDRIHVTHLGASKKVAEDGQLKSKAVLRRLGVRDPYVLSVAAPARHKNTERLIEGFRVFKKANGSAHTLVLIGPREQRPYGSGAVKPEDDVVSFEFLSDELLDVLYRGASGFVLASYYEGFGLPVLEALTYDLPVACSWVASLPEVAGEAAVGFDPFDVNSIATALSRTLLDAATRDALARARARQVQKFSWAECYRKTHEVLRQAAAG